ncbi:MAG: hypothetical protein WC843_01970 [Candidatus Gracilibacteria bacterium]|jgi:hypothetical protein
MSYLIQKGTTITDMALDADIEEDDDGLRNQLDIIFEGESPKPYPDESVLSNSHFYLALTLDRYKKLAPFICKTLAQFENFEELAKCVDEKKKPRFRFLKKIITLLSQIQDPKIRQATYEALKKEAGITLRIHSTRAAILESSIPQDELSNMTDSESRDIEIEKELTVLLFTWISKADTREDKAKTQLFFRTPNYIYFKLLIKTHHRIEEDELLQEILEKLNSISSPEKQQEIFDRLHKTNCIS